MLFSQRESFKAIKTIIQIDGIDEDLRVGLWNELTIHYFRRLNTWLNNDLYIKILIEYLWQNYFKLPLDTLNEWGPDVRNILRGKFKDADWFEIYDFIEFIANNDPLKSRSQDFMDGCNVILEKELSGYRFVDRKILKISSPEEITEIEEALNKTNPLKPANTHLQRALELLADRKKPDFRNSIKESISAVETICRLITKNPKATLNDTLKKIEEKIEIHPALKIAFSKLYGYTSDAEGIRHSLINESKLDFEDAKFFLVSCSAFINYLLSKSSKIGINL